MGTEEEVAEMEKEVEVAVEMEEVEAEVGVEMEEVEQRRWRRRWR